MFAPQLMSIGRRSLATLLGVAWLGGCVQAPTVRGEWQAGATRG